MSTSIDPGEAQQEPASKKRKVDRTSTESGDSGIANDLARPNESLIKPVDLNAGKENPSLEDYLVVPVVDFAETQLVGFKARHNPPSKVKRCKAYDGRRGLGASKK